MQLGTVSLSAWNMLLSSSEENILQGHYLFRVYPLPWVLSIKCDTTSITICDRLEVREDFDDFINGGNVHAIQSL
jgi:hypothetical protein